MFFSLRFFSFDKVDQIQGPCLHFEEYVYNYQFKLIIPYMIKQPVIYPFKW